VTYQETVNGDSSNVYVDEPEFSLLNLQPGRNYSVGVQAVAKGIESVGKSINVATRKTNVSQIFNVFSSGKYL
jgi:hypothetical protein